jgi:threonyl-tRNA synthetase
MRFDLGYLAADQSLRRPVMIHRSIIGSLERLLAHLIEVYAGAFPAWLAPVQLVVLPVTDDQVPPAEALAQRCIQAGLRAEVCQPDRGSLAARIRTHRLVPYQAILGHREANNDVIRCACAPVTTSIPFLSNRHYAASPAPSPTAATACRSSAGGTGQVWS